jgi:nucleoside-diphosphate-sugar epimerase
MKKPLWLVTGGAGFIGSNIVEELLRRGKRVRVFDNFSTGTKENLEPFKGRFDLVKGDLRNPKDCAKAMKGVTYVLHHPSGCPSRWTTRWRRTTTTPPAPSTPSWPPRPPA